MNPFSMILNTLQTSPYTTSPKASNALLSLKLGAALHDADPVAFDGPAGPEVLRRVAAFVGVDAPAYRDLAQLLHSVGAI